MRALLEDARSFSLASDPGGRYPCKALGCGKTFAQVCSAMRHERRCHQLWRSKTRSSGSFGQSDDFGPGMNAEGYDDDDVCITAVSTRHGDGDGGYLQSHWSRNGNGGILIPSLGVGPVDLVPSLGDDDHEPVDRCEEKQQLSELARYVDATRGNQTKPNDAGRL